jgi:predicted PurR-regulated permease PerM
VEPTFRAANVRAAFLIIIAVAVSALFIAVVWPFLKPLLLAALFAALAHPLYNGSRGCLGKGAPSPPWSLC